MAINKKKVADGAWTHDKVPAAAFMRKLKALDRQLDVRWNAPLQRWDLIRWGDQPKQTPHGVVFVERDWTPLATLQNAEGGYLELGDRVIEMIQRADTWGVNMDEYLRRQDQLEELREEQQRQRVKDEFAAWVRDHRVQYSRWKTGQPVVLHHRNHRMLVKP